MHVISYPRLLNNLDWEATVTHSATGEKLFTIHGSTLVKCKERCEFILHSMRGMQMQDDYRWRKPAPLVDARDMFA